MALRKILILRSVRSTRHEGRRVVIQLATDRFTNSKERHNAALPAEQTHRQKNERPAHAMDAWRALVSRPLWAYARF